MLTNSMFWKARFRAASIHLGISLALAALSAMLVFFVWYPYPYREISGGRSLFLLVITVDVIIVSFGIIASVPSSARTTT